MGNCLPSCQKRNKVVPLRTYVTSSTRAISRYNPQMSKTKLAGLKCGSQSSVRSSKPAAAEQNITVLHGHEITSKLSYSSFVSADDSVNSVLVRCVRSNSEFDSVSLPIDRPPAPSPMKMQFQYKSSLKVSQLVKKDIMGQSQIRGSEADALKEGQGTSVRELEQESLHAQPPSVVVNEETKDAEDKSRAKKAKKKERPVSSKTYIVQYEDSYLRKKAREMSQQRKAARDVASTGNEDNPECSVAGEKTEQNCAQDASKLERSVSAYFEHSDEEQTREAPPRRERPRPADYNARRPKFTDPLIVCDVDDEEFQAVFTDDGKKIHAAEETLLLSELQEAIDYILTDKPLSKGTSDTQVDVQGDNELVSAAGGTEGACAIAQEVVCTARSLGSGELEQIGTLRKQLHSTICQARTAPCDEPVQKDTDSESEIGSGFLAPPNSPRRARPRPTKATPTHSGTLPSMLASRARGYRGRVGRKASALNYSVEELKLMGQIERGL